MFTNIHLNFFYKDALGIRQLLAELLLHGASGGISSVSKFEEVVDAGVVNLRLWRGGARNREHLAHQARLRVELVKAKEAL